MKRLIALLTLALLLLVSCSGEDDEQTAAFDVSLKLSADTVAVNETVTGFAAATGTVDEYVWSSDEYSSKGSDANHSFKFTEAGEKVITVAIHNNNGESDSASEKVFVEAAPNPPVAHILGITSGSAIVNSAVTAIISVTGGEGDLTYHWSAEDVEAEFTLYEYVTVNDMTQSFIFRATGARKISVFVTDANGNKSKTKSITVNVRSN